MTDEEVRREFGREKGVMRARFRTGTQRALVNADLMYTSDVMLLQAFSLYIVRRELHSTEGSFCF